MKRYMLTLLTVLAMGIGTQALAEEDTQTAASTEAVSDASPVATDATTDAASDASAATDPMPASTDGDSK
jgi:hypothetical protein